MPTNQEKTTIEPRISESRRRLVQGGLAGAPVLMMLKSTPALATTTCKQPSGFSVSGNLSRPDDFTCTPFPGPTTWVGMLDLDPKPSWRNNDLLTILGDNGQVDALKQNGKVKIKNALQNGDAFIKYMVCAYLNLQHGTNGYVPGVTLSQLQAMWMQAPSSGYQALSSPQVVIWYKADVLNYLQYTMNP